MPNKFKTKVYFSEALVTPDYRFKTIRMKHLDEIGNVHKHTPIRAIESITQLFSYSFGQVKNERDRNIGYLAIIDGKLNHLELNIDTNYDLNFWDVYGQFYGFPDCCVKNFNEHLGDHSHIPPDHFFSETGFIPCPVCVTKPHTEVLAEIKSRRFFSVPFTERGSTASDEPKIPELVDFLMNHYQPKNFN